MIDRLLFAVLGVWLSVLCVSGPASARSQSSIQVQSSVVAIPKESTSVAHTPRVQGSFADPSLPSELSEPAPVTSAWSEAVPGSSWAKVYGRGFAKRVVQLVDASHVVAPKLEATRHTYDAHPLLRVSHAGMATETGTAADDAVAAACSFGGETAVLMANGSVKSISLVVVGDIVVAQDPDTGEVSARTVTHAWVHDDDLVRLEIDGDIVRTTEDHPFWNDTDQEWQRADQLDAGDYALENAIEFWPMVLEVLAQVAG